MPAPPSPSDDRSPDLIWAEDGSPRSGRFGDVYFSTDDGLAESRAVFLRGCDLPNAWAGRDRFTVAELGFGTGLNVAALLGLWRRERPLGSRLNIVSVEAFPLTREEAERALFAWPDLSDISAILLRLWPKTGPGFHRMDLPELDATLDLLVGDAATVLAGWTGQADAWFLDGFSPALNPAMWSPEVFDRIADRSAPDARLATFTVAGAVRRSLSERGFQVDKRPGHGRKRERLEARRTGLPAVPAPPRRVAVIGGGIAGASVCRALLEAGAQPVLLEADAPGAGASGFPGALVTPRLDAGDPTISGLYAQALERARDLYTLVPGAVTADVVIQLEQSPRDAARFAKVAAQPHWSPGEMRAVDAETTSTLIDEPLADGGLSMAGALAIRPAPVIEAWLAGVTRITGEVARLDPTPSGWRVIAEDGGVHAEVDAVVVASGWGTARLLPELALSPVRGQADWIEGVHHTAIAWGGYVAPTGTGLLYGATHQRGDTATDVRADDSARNLGTLSSRLPALAERVASLPVAARAAIRATTPDRLPLCGPVPDRPGVWVLGGLGSRGFCAAPLLGEHLAALITDRPSPLPRPFADRLRPGRFAAPLRDGPSG